MITATVPVRRLGFISGFVKGFWAPIQAIGTILTSPRLLILITVPLALNIALYVLFFYYGVNYSDQLISGWMHSAARHLPDWTWLLAVTRWLLRVLAWLTLALIGALSFTVVSALLLAPFNDSISRTSLQIRQRSLKHAPETELKLPIAKVVTLELRRSMILIAGAVFLALFGLIPLMQLPALALGAWLLSFEYFGYPLSQKTHSLWAVARFTTRNVGVSLGLGSFLLLMMMVPFASIVYIPLAVVSGSMLYVDLALANGNR